MFESTNLSRDDLSREIGRSSSKDAPPSEPVQRTGQCREDLKGGGSQGGVTDYIQSPY